MLRQASGRSHRSKKLRPSQSLQAFLLVAVGVWIVYQLARTYGKRRIVAVETGGSGCELARRRLGRKGFVDIAAGQASVDDVVGVGDGSHDGRGADSSDNPLSEAGDAGDEEDPEADEDDGVVNGDPDDADDGLAADEEDDDDRDLQFQNGSSGEDELKTAHGETKSGLNTSIAPPVNATDTVQDGAAVLPANATGRAADGTALTLSGSALKNTSSVDLTSLNAREAAGDVANKNGTADSGPV